MRKWFPVLYGIGFILLLSFLALDQTGINRQMWKGAFGRATEAELRFVSANLAPSLGIVVLLVVLLKLIQRIDPRFEPEVLVLRNPNFRPLTWRFWRWPFAMLLLWNLPMLATLEEFIFRHGGWGFPGPIVTMQDVLLRTVAFGAFHALMTLNWRGGIMQAMLGFWFSYLYLSADHDPWLRASQAHFTVDLMVVGPALLQLLLKPIRR